ncbi:MAG: PD40 domain-containing protein, partial [Deltaproteobacteria bacterium]|nr:PD40 domain-containing protein [Deltaproteobacteria bacterium]
AIPDFVPTGGGAAPDISGGLSKRLGDNLDMTGMFINLDKRTFLGADAQSGSPDFKEWKAVGSELLVKGGFSLSGDQLVMELRLFDVFDGKMLLGKRYTGGRNDGRKIITRFTNEILKLLTGEAGNFGTQIIFVTGGPVGKAIMMVEFGSDEVVPVAGGGSGPSQMPAISPSGSIAYIHRNGKSWELRVGGQVISAGPLHLSPAFAPNGALYAAISGKYDTNIFMFPGPGAKPVQVTNYPGINISPAFSPDGSQMAFVSDRSGSAQIYLASVKGGEAKRVTMSGGRNMDPSWSPRGDRIIFCCNETEICSINPDGTDLQKLSSGSYDSRPSWSPDGRMVVFSSSRSGKSQLYVMTANGDRQQLLIPDYPGEQRDPFWSPAKSDN